MATVSTGFLNFFIFLIEKRKLKSLREAFAFHRTNNELNDNCGKAKGSLPQLYDKYVALGAYKNLTKLHICFERPNSSVYK